MRFVGALESIFIGKAHIQNSPGAYCTPGLPGTPGSKKGGNGGEEGKGAPGGCLAAGGDSTLDFPHCEHRPTAAEVFGCKAFNSAIFLFNQQKKGWKWIFGDNIFNLRFFRCYFQLARHDQ